MSRNGLRRRSAGLAALAAVLLLSLLACTDGIDGSSGADGRRVGTAAKNTLGAAGGVPSSMVEGEVFDLTSLPASNLYSTSSSVTLSAYPPSDPTCSTTPLFSQIYGQYHALDSSISGVQDDLLALITSGQTGLVRWTMGSTGPGSQDLMPCDIAGAGVGLDVTAVTSSVPQPVPTGAPNATYTAMLGWPISAEANMRMYSLPRTATGTVDLRAYSPEDSTCSAAPVFDSGPLPLLAGFASTSFTPTRTGTYNWVLNYAGDDLYAGVSSLCGATATLVLPAGATFVVNDANDADNGTNTSNCTLRGAIAAANANSAATTCNGVVGSASGIDTITFAASLGSITLNSVLSAISDNLYIEGNGTSSTIIAGGGGLVLGSGLGSATGVMVRLDNLSLSSTLRSAGGELDLDNVTFTGAPMLFEVGSNNNDGRYVLNSVTAQNSSASSPGASALADEYAPILYIGNSLFSGNTNTGDTVAGAVELRRLGIAPQDGINFVRISNSRFTNNEGVDGGAINITNNPQTVPYDPDALTVSILNSTFDANNAGNPANLGSGEQTVSGSAIYIQNAAVIVANSTFSGNAINTATVTGGVPEGGAIALNNYDDTGTNAADGHMDATLLLLNDSFANNTVTPSSTEYYSPQSNLPADIATSIPAIGYNVYSSGPEYPPTFIPPSSWLIVKNTFFSTSDQWACAEEEFLAVGDGLNPLGFSGGSTFTNIDNTSYTESPGGTCGDVLGIYSSTDSYGDNLSVAAMEVLPLAGNGGPTPTLALGSGSPMIATGNNLACAEAGPTDQRGVPRPTDRNCSIGAYEPTVFILTTQTSGGGSGSVAASPAGTGCGNGCLAFLSGTATTLTATAASGSAFAGWSGVCSGSSTCSLTLDQNQSVTAIFYDTTPNAFSFTPVTGVTPGGTAQYSNPITVTGVTGPTPISITAGAEYSINGGAFTNNPGMVNAGDTVVVELPPSSSFGATASTVLDIGGVSATFDVVTATSLNPPIDVDCSANDLITAINTANNQGSNPGPNIIVLSAGCIYDFTAPNQAGSSNMASFNWYGPSALPAIASDITIVGNGATIQRDSAAINNFRLFYVAPANGTGGPNDGYTTPAPAGVTPALRLESLTLSGGLAKGGDSDLGGGGLGAGGAIFNQGVLTLTAVTLSGNEALGGSAGITTAGNGGGGMGTDAPNNGSNAGGGFGSGSFGGATGAANGGGGGGFKPGDSASGRSGGGANSGLGGASSFQTAGDGAGAGGGGSGAGGGFGQPGAYSAGGGVGGGGGATSGPAGGGGFGGGGGYGGGIGGGGGFGAGAGAGAGNEPSGFAGGSPSSSLGGGGSGMGGAVFNMQGQVSAINSTFASNQAVHGSGANNGTSAGAAIFNLNGTVTLSYSTLAYNTADAGGAVYNLIDDQATVRSASVTLGSTIAAQDTANLANQGNDVQCNVADTASGDASPAATISAGDDNLVMSSLAQNGCSISGTSLASNPMLATALAANGASDVPQTLALQSGSLAIGAADGANCPFFDQRGFARIGNVCDIGAYEHNATPLFTVATGATPDGDVTSNTVTISGLTGLVPFLVSGSASGIECSFNGSAYASCNQDVFDGETVSIELLTSAASGSLVDALLDIDGYSAMYSATTLTAPVIVACTGNSGTDAKALSAAIDTANAEGAGGVPVSIYLGPGCTYDFTSSNEVGASDPTRFNWYGPSALPAIASNITIVGNGDTIQRDATATTDFRLFYVAPANGTGGPNDGYTTPAPAGVTPTLTLQNLTLSGGLAKGGDSNLGGGGLGAGGAIFSQGAVVLSAVTLNKNEALGGSGGVTGAGNGGGGIGTSAPKDGSNAGGGFGRGSFGGAGGGAAGGGGGFKPGDVASTQSGGGTNSGLGGASSNSKGGDGSGAASPITTSQTGGAFAQGGANSAGGGVGGGGGAYSNSGTPGGGGGFGGGGGYGNDLGGGGGFGGGSAAGADGGTVPGFAAGSGNTSMGGGGSGMGGAIFNMQGTLTITNTTFFGNQAVHGTGASSGTSAGAAIFNLNGTVNLGYSTLVDNIADVGGGVYNAIDDLATVRNAQMTMSSVIVAQNTANISGQAGDVQCDVVNTDSGDANPAASVGLSDHDLVLSAQSMLAQNGCSIGTPAATGNPTLASSLAANGASGVPYTLAELSGSPAIGGGDLVGCPAVDERGQPRNNGYCDIGAYEFQETSSAPTPAGSHAGYSPETLNFGPVVAGNAVSLTVTVTDLHTNQCTGTDASCTLGINGISIVGADAGDFSVSVNNVFENVAYCTNSSDEPGICTVTVSFNPQAGGTRTASLVISSFNDNVAGTATTPDASSPRTIPLNGIGEFDYNGDGLWATTDLAYGLSPTGPVDQLASGSLSPPGTPSDRQTPDGDGIDLYAKQTLGLPLDEKDTLPAWACDFGQGTDSNGFGVRWLLTNVINANQSCITGNLADSTDPDGWLPYGSVTTVYNGLVSGSTLSVNLAVDLPLSRGTPGGFMLQYADGSWNRVPSTVSRITLDKWLISFNITDGGPGDVASTPGVINWTGGPYLDVSLALTPSSALLAPGQSQTFSFSNTSNLNLGMGQAAIGGGSGYSITADSCSNQTLAAQAGCSVTVQLGASASGGPATLSLPSNHPYQSGAPFTVYLSSAESVGQQAERRLPPTAETVQWLSDGAPVSSLQPGQAYTLQLGGLSYDDSTSIIGLVFACAVDSSTGVIDDSSCAADTGSAVAQLVGGTPTTAIGDYDFMGEPAQLLTYGLSYTVPAGWDTSQQLVLRLYYNDGNDAAMGSNTVSMLIPGGQAGFTAVGTQGRKIAIGVSP